MICRRDLAALRSWKIKGEHLAVAVGEALVGTARCVDVSVEDTLRQQAVARPRITRLRPVGNSRSQARRDDCRRGIAFDVANAGRTIDTLALEKTRERPHQNSRDLISRKCARGARARQNRPRSAGYASSKGRSALQPGHRHSPTNTDSRRVRDNCADQHKRARLRKRPKSRPQRGPITSSSW
jgi:hypothetical protein